MARVKQHFKLHTSIRTHRKTAAIWRDVRLRAMYVELARLATEKWATRTGDTVLVGGTDLCFAAGLAGSQQANAQRRLDRLVRVASAAVADGEEPCIRYEHRGEGLWAITLPNLSEKQGVTESGPRRPKPAGTGPASGRVEAGTGPASGQQPKVPESKENGQQELTPSVALTVAVVKKDISSDLPAASESTEGKVPRDERGSPVAPDLKPPKVRDRGREAKRAWHQCRQAAAGYGKRWGPNLSRQRQSWMAARLRDHPDDSPEILEHVIHGAMRSWSDAGEGWNPIRHLTPETLYRPSNFEKYLEAYRDSGAPVTPDGGIASKEAARRIEQLERRRSGVYDE